MQSAKSSISQPNFELKVESPSVVIDKNICSGVPVLAGTRFPIYRILAEIGDGISLEEIAAEYDLRVTKITRLLDDLAIAFEKPAV